MKIQVGSKGEVAWDVFLEALRKEELLEERLRHSRSSLACAKRWPRKCLDHRVILVLLLGICLLSYGLMYWINLKLSALKNQTGHIVYNNALGKVYHIHFSWKNCGQSDDPMQLTKLKVSPDPVHLDRNITLDLVSFINMDIDKDHQLSASVTVERRIGWIWVEIPCLFGFGSCFYKDVCKVLPFPPEEPCPDPFPRFNIPCHCPIRHGSYSLHNGTFNLSAILAMFPLPHWLVSGDYYSRVFMLKEDIEMGCYEVYSSIVA